MGYGMDCQQGSFCFGHIFNGDTGLSTRPPTYRPTLSLCLPPPHTNKHNRERERERERERGRERVSERKALSCT